MSSLSMTTAACWAFAGAETEAGNRPASAAKPITATVEYKTCLRFMFALPGIPGLGALCLGAILHPTRPVLRASEGCDDVARPTTQAFQWPAAAHQPGNAPAFLPSGARGYRPTSDLARMLVWISGVPSMTEQGRELRERGRAAAISSSSGGSCGVS